MLYILKENDNIVGFGKTPFSLVANQTQETLNDVSLNDYAGRFALSADKTSIQADDSDSATVTLSTSTAASSIDVDVNGVTVSVSLSDGVGVLPPITAETAGTIRIKPADETQYSAAGNGSISITAVEV